MRYITNIVCVFEREADGLFGSARSRPVPAACVAAGCSLSAAAPAQPTAFVSPPEP